MNPTMNYITNGTTSSTELSNRKMNAAIQIDGFAKLEFNFRGRWVDGHAVRLG
jgi:hypothetical protein